MKITLAKTAGFCFGVDRAIKLVYDLASLNHEVRTIGPIIHNSHVVNDLNTKGVRIVDNLSQVGKYDTVVIRSHGVGRATYDELIARNLNFCDATCPYVSKIHRIVTEKSKEGFLILIAGDENHPEIKGIQGHCVGKSYVFKNEKELENIHHIIEDIDKYSIVFVAQTTFELDLWENCKKVAKKLYTNALFFDTICKATTARQIEAKEIARKSDLMFVIGGKESSNTQKLKSVCEKYTKTVLIENKYDLDKNLLRGVENVGITAGASTPADIIEEVLTTMSEDLKNVDEELSFAELFEQTETEKLYSGMRIKGTVTSVSKNEIKVDIGAKQTGIVLVSELSDDPNLTPDEIVKPGDEIETIVLKVNDQEGVVMLSKKRCDAQAGLDSIREAFEAGTVLEGIVVSAVRGGVLVLTNNVKVFIPASQVSDRRVEDLNTLLKQTVHYKIIEMKEKSNRAVGSVRQALNEKKAAAQEKFWSEVEIGKTYTGTVKSLTNYGAFVDLGGIDGMIHITELSWGRIKHPSDIVRVGDTVEVYIKDIDVNDPKHKKISLGYRKTEENPWVIFEKDYAVGDEITAKIVSITPFGAFAEIIPGVDGLIHISQIANQRIDKVDDVLQVGQEVKAKITAIDIENKRISLSMRVLLEEAPQPKEEEEEHSTYADDLANIEGVEITSD